MEQPLFLNAEFRSSDRSGLNNLYNGSCEWVRYGVLSVSCVGLPPPISSVLAARQNMETGMRRRGVSLHSTLSASPLHPSGVRDEKVGALPGRIRCDPFHLSPASIVDLSGLLAGLFRPLDAIPTRLHRMKLAPLCDAVVEATLRSRCHHRSCPMTTISSCCPPFLLERVYSTDSPSF